MVQSQSEKKHRSADDERHSAARGFSSILAPMKNLSHTPRSSANAASSGRTTSRSPRRSMRPEPLELGERVAHLELDGDAECRLQPRLDPRFELARGRRRGGGAQEMVGEERLLAVLFLGGADHVVEHAGIVVDVAVIDVVGQLHLIFERLALILHPLPGDEAAERDEARERRQSRLGVAVGHGGADAEIKSEQQEQDGDGGVDLQQDRDAAGKRRNAEEQHVASAQHHAGVGKQRVEVAARDVAEAFEQHGARRKLATIETARAPRRGRPRSVAVLVFVAASKTTSS